MVQPARRIITDESAADAALALETPSEVRRFVALAEESRAVREYLGTDQWDAIWKRIMGDGRAPTGRPNSIADMARFFRWAADGAISSTPVSDERRRAFLHCATELDAFASRFDQMLLSSATIAQPAGALSFSEALDAVKTGAHITRAAWTGGSYVTAQAGYPQGIGVNQNTAGATGLPVGTQVAFPPYLIRRLPVLAPVVDDGKFVEPTPAFTPWTPDQADLFATDWRIVPRPRA